MDDEDSPDRRRARAARGHAWWAITTAVYAAVMAATSAWSMADTMDYVASIREALEGEPSPEFWEFGHLLWRPLGYVTCRIASPLIGRNPASGAITALIVWNWLAGLVGALALHPFLRSLGVRRCAVWVVVLAYLLSFGVLNYAHSGSPYVPGLACLLAAMALLVRRDPLPAGWAVAAGVAMALAVGLWLPYLLVIPASLAFHPVWYGPDRRRWRLAAAATAAFAMTLGSAYLAAIWREGIRDVDGFREWVGRSSHGITNISGVSRVAFGIPRSFVSMGKDGILFKRYLLHDPYNPVALGELVRASLAKIALVYATMLATLAGLSRGPAGRRLLALGALGAVPVLGFAVKWQGGDVERYMPAYPLVFAAWGVVLGGDRPSRIVQGIVLALVVVMGVANVPALSRVASDRARDRLVRRVEGLRPTLGAGSRVFVVTNQDPLVRAGLDPYFPRDARPPIRVLIPLGYADAPAWRSRFGREALATWGRGGKVWVSRRALAERPRADWDWVEGDERSVPWSDIPAFFAAFEFGEPLGGEDGFVPLARSPHNEELLRRAGAEPPGGGRAEGRGPSSPAGAEEPGRPRADVSRGERR